MNAYFKQFAYSSTVYAKNPTLALFGPIISYFGPAEL